ncbi:hypothetical protein SMIR_14270 [Streptomyces mirabilis]|nr:hypothetical protein HEP84_30875 [Streptomyces sp. RLB1-33]QUW80146.1 hypothetical protein SMIR_14270 [Streptomyces mirabilis]
MTPSTADRPQMLVEERSDSSASRSMYVAIDASRVGRCAKSRPVRGV